MAGSLASSGTGFPVQQCVTIFAESVVKGKGRGGALECAMYAFEKIAEERILEAMERGEFNSLEGRGQPLPPEDCGIKLAPELRVAYKIMKNANVLPAEIEMLKEIERIEELLLGIGDEDERYQHVRRMNGLVSSFNIMRKAPIALEKNQYYFQKIGEKFLKQKP